MTAASDDDGRIHLHDRLAEHARLRSLCDRLEAIADELPALPPRRHTQALVAELTALLLARQDNTLIETLADAGSPAGTRRALAERIRSQQVTDLVHAQDLGMALAEADGDKQALGYMLRCFFLGCRRALAFEELAILHLGGTVPPELELAIATALAPREGRVD